VTRRSAIEYQRTAAAAAAAGGQVQVNQSIIGGDGS